MGVMNRQPGLGPAAGATVGPPTYLGQKGPELVQLLLQGRVILLRLRDGIPACGWVGGGGWYVRAAQVPLPSRCTPGHLSSTRALTHFTPVTPLPVPRPRPTHPPNPPDLADGGGGASAHHHSARPPRRHHSAAEQRVGLVLDHSFGGRHGSGVLGHAAAFSRKDRLPVGLVGWVELVMNSTGVGLAGRGCTHPQLAGHGTKLLTNAPRTLLSACPPGQCAAWRTAAA